MWPFTKVKPDDPDFNKEPPQREHWVMWAEMEELLAEYDAQIVALEVLGQENAKHIGHFDIEKVGLHQQLTAVRAETIAINAKMDRLNDKLDVILTMKAKKKELL